MITAQQDRDRARQALAQLAEHVGPAAVASAQLPEDCLGAESAADPNALTRGHLETIAALESQVRLGLDRPSQASKEVHAQPCGGRCTVRVPHL